MWSYAAVLLGCAVTAEAVGLGGIPRHSVEIANVLFIVLMLALAAKAICGLVRR